MNSWIFFNGENFRIISNFVLNFLSLSLFLDFFDIYFICFFYK